MKFLRIASLLWTVTILSSALCLATARADDQDLPPPQGSADTSTVSAPVDANPPADASLPGDDGSLDQSDSGSGVTDEVPPAQAPQPDLDEENSPDPSLGQDALPAPDANLEQNRESDKNQVNNPPPQDDIFLPSPAAQDNVNYAPLGSPVASQAQSDPDWKLGMDSRPVFTLHGGWSVWNYPTKAIESNRSGPTVGASIRLFSLAQTIFLHAYGSFSFVSLGSVGPYEDVRDTVLHVGGLVEIGIGRRLSFFGSFLHCGHTMTAGSTMATGVPSLDYYTPNLSSGGWKLGAGLQYDFYVVPHGSLGIRAHFEKDMGLVALTMSLEPRPRQRLSLNFQE